METKKIYQWGLFALLAGLCALQANAQSIKYTYDDAGNRTERSKLTVQSMTRAAVSNGETQPADTPEKAGEPVQLEEMLAGTKVTIYPNPTKGMLRVDITASKIPKDACIHIYNVSGTLVRQLTGVSATNNIDISAQPAGTYIMRIMLDKENVSVWKVIKK